MNRTASPNLPPLPEESSPFDLREFLRRYLWRYRYLFALSLVMATGSTMLYLRYATPEYLVRATLLIKSPEDEGSGLSEEAILQDLGLGRKAGRLENEIQILRSRTLMEQVVRRLSLHITYFSDGRIRSNELYRSSPIQLDSAVLSEEAYGRTVLLKDLPGTGRFQWTSNGKVSEYPYGRPFTNRLGAFVVRKHPTPTLSSEPCIMRMERPEDVAEQYAGRLHVQVVGGFSTVLELSLKDAVPEKGTAVLNQLVKAYNQAAIEDQNRVSRNTLAFIDDRLRLLTAELAGVERAVERYKSRHGIPLDATAGGSRLLAEVAAFREERSRLQIRIDLLESVASYLRRPENRFALIPLHQAFGSDQLSALITAYNGAILEREALRRSARDANPVLEQLRARLAKEREGIRAALETHRIQLKARLEALENDHGENLDRMRSIPRKERELLEIQRQQTIKADLYLYLLEKREETALSMAVTAPNSRLIDPARPSKKPVAPNRHLLYALALFSGLALPALFVLFRELLDDRVQVEADIRRETTIPLLGGVNFPRAGNRRVVQPLSQDPLAERFRLLRTSLSFFQPEPEQAVVLISSVMSGEGKTFVTGNLARSLALDGKKTLAVELDLRKPRLGQDLLGTKRPPHRYKGLSHYLAEQAEITDVLRAVPGQEGLFCIPSGPAPPNPAELINRKRMRDLIRTLKKEFDYILLDSPPIGLVTDGLLLSSLADVSLFVLRFGYTKKRALHLLDELVQNQVFRRAALVTNGCYSGEEYGYWEAYSRYGGKRNGPPPARIGFSLPVGWKNNGRNEPGQTV